MKVTQKLLIALIVLLVLAVGTLIGLRWFFNKDPVDRKDSEIIISAYARVCKTSPEKTRPFWESIASSAIDKHDQSLDEALWEYSLEDTQRFRTSALGRIQDAMYALVGYDPYRQIEQKAFKTANQVFLDDMQFCFHYQVFESEQARKEQPKVSKDLSSVTHEHFIQNAAKTAEIGSVERWQVIQKDQGSFLNHCVAEEKDLAVRVGKMNPTEAEKQAMDTCHAQLAEIRECMNAPSSNAAACFTDVLERGD